MALENVTKFMEQYAEDEALQAKIEGKSADEVKAVAAEMGFEFTTDELKQFGESMTQLSLDELEAASGGNIEDYVPDNPFKEIPTPEELAGKIVSKAPAGLKQAGAEWSISVAKSYKKVKNFFNNLF